MSAESLEKPLPKPSTEDYVVARLLESIVEAKLALDFLSRGLIRNASGKAFQSWKAFITALLRLELSKLLEITSREDKEWLVKKAVPRAPTTRMKWLSQLLEQVGHDDISVWTDKALNLHDYQYNGPDPDMALSKYRNREEAAYDIIKLVNEVAKRTEGLKERIKWSPELEKVLKELEEMISKPKSLQK
jgi:hypothetical protein